VSSSVYSRRLGQITAPAHGVLTPVVTVPAGYVYVVKTLISYCDTPPGDLSWFISVGIALIRQEASAIASTIERELQIVLNAGESLDVIATTGGWQLSAHGYALSA
jgi:hypothetical protein